MGTPIMKAALIHEVCAAVGFTQQMLANNADERQHAWLINWPENSPGDLVPGPPWTHASDSEVCRRVTGSNGTRRLVLTGLRLRAMTDD